MDNANLAFVAVVGIMSLMLLGYQVMKNHEKVGFIMMLPARFIPLLPFALGTVPPGGYPMSDLMFIPAWYFAFSFEFKYSWYAASAFAVIGAVMHHYGA